MTAADHLAALARWGDQSSEPYHTPNSRARASHPPRNFFGQPIPQPVEKVAVGRYFEIIPWDFTTAPTTDFDANALPLFVSFEQAEALNLPPVADLSPPSSQGRAFDRLDYILGKMEDACGARGMAWRADDGWYGRRAHVVALDDPLEPIADAIRRVGADDASPAFPTLAAPLFKMTRKERDGFAGRLPLVHLP